MRPAAFLIAACAVVGIGFWLLQGSGFLDSQLPKGKEGADPTTWTRESVGPISTPEAGNAAHEASPTENGGDPAPGTAPTSPGALLIMARNEDGTSIADLAARVSPSLGKLTSESGPDGLLLRGIPPGDYQVEVWAGGFVPFRLPTQTIHAGATTSFEVQLQRGIRVAGFVHDEETMVGVKDVIVQFDNHAQTRTGSDGRFALPYDLPREALTTIATSHPEFDDVRRVFPAVFDPGNIRIGLTRGSNTVSGLIHDRLGRLGDAQIELELALVTGTRNEVRRRIKNKGPRFKIPRVHAGRYRLTVRFPGMNISDRSTQFDLNYNEEKWVEMEIAPGCNITGIIHGDMKRPMATRIALINDRGVSVAESQSPTDGTFSLNGIEAGDYRFKIWYSVNYSMTQPIKVDGKTPQSVRIDALKKRWFPQ